MANKKTPLKGVLQRYITTLANKVYSPLAGTIGAAGTKRHCSEWEKVYLPRQNHQDDIIYCICFSYKYVSKKDVTPALFYSYSKLLTDKSRKKS
jgi:hypothetical protein